MARIFTCAGAAMQMTVGEDSSSDGNGGMQDIEERVKFKSPTLSLSSSGTQRYAALLLPLAGSGT